MGGKPKTENTKKAAGNAKKAEAAAQKGAAEEAKKAAAEASQWNQGAKSNAKKDEADARKAEAARKKAEKDALLAAEEAETSTARSAPKNSKTATKKTKGLDLSQLDDSTSAASTSKTNPALNASGIENALDALSITTGNPNAEKVDRHPERRYKAAYAAYEARRMPEVEVEFRGLRKQQREALIRKEFEKSEENPFNQVNARFDTSKQELREIKEKEREKTESRLAEK